MLYSVHAWVFNLWFEYIPLYMDCVFGVFHHFEQYWSYIVDVSSISGGNWITHRKSNHEFIRHKSTDNLYQLYMYNVVVSSTLRQLGPIYMEICFVVTLRKPNMHHFCVCVFVRLCCDIFTDILYPLLSWLLYPLVSINLCLNFECITSMNIQTVTNL